MNSDCAFVMGRTHKVCEDFALAGSAPFPYAIICDGCSSSPATDTGARLLAWTLRQSLRALPMEASPDALNAWMEKVAQKTADLAFNHLGLPPGAMDVTVGLVFQHADHSTAILWGDGAILARNRQGSKTIRRVSFDNNAPYYPSYLTDAKRQAIYRQQMAPGEGLNKVETCDRQTPQRLPYHHVTIHHFPRTEYDLVAVTSDGVDSFRHLADNAPYPMDAVVDELLAIPGFSGAFMTRRLGRMIKQLAKDDIHPTDDLAVGILAATDEG